MLPVGCSHNLRLEDTYIAAICQEGAKLEDLARWKRSVCEKSKLDIDCRPPKYEIIYDIPKLIKQDKYIMHNCHHNEFIGLRNRYLKSTQNEVTYDTNIVEKILDELCDKMRPYWVRPATLQEYMDDKKGKLWKRYADTIKKINETGFDLSKHSGTSAFVKNELYDELKPPRMIINRDTRFNLAYGRYTTALEHCMVKVPQFSKGKNFIERGAQFEELVYDPFCDILEGDASKFEGTQRPELLVRIELGIWKRLLVKADFEYVRKLFYQKLIKRGYTQNGVKFSFFGCRGSGDQDTGLFNSILMWVACRYFEIINNFNWSGKFCVDGDDNIIKIPKNIKFINTFATFGFDAKLIVRHDYHDVDYCSGKFIQINKMKFMYVQNIVKIINNMSYFRKRQFQHCKKEYYHSLGYMYSIIYRGLPLFSDFANFLLRSTKGAHIKTEILKELNPMYVDVLHRSNYEMVDYDENIRIELCMSFGMTTGVYESIREFYKTTSIEFRKDESKRYRSGGTARMCLEQEDFIKCETLLNGV